MKKIHDIRMGDTIRGNTVFIFPVFDSWAKDTAPRQFTDGHDVDRTDHRNLFSRQFLRLQHWQKVIVNHHATEINQISGSPEFS